MNGELYEVVCAKFGHKIENCPYLAQISHCVDCPYVRYLKREISSKQEEQAEEENNNHVD